MPAASVAAPAAVEARGCVAIGGGEPAGTASAGAGDRGDAPGMSPAEVAAGASTLAAAGAGGENPADHAQIKRIAASPATRCIRDRTNAGADAMSIEARDPEGREVADDATVHDGAANAGTAQFRAEGRTLYVVATPLGNLRDMTLRAVDILRTADVVAAEDTRVSSTLLRHYGIAARLLSLHAHNEASRARVVLRRLAEGDSVALVTDAGTPGISDPGARMVGAAREAGFVVVPVPGPCAAIAALSAAGIRAERFLFGGFLPGSRKAREAILRAVPATGCALVIYEAPHRVRATVADLAAFFGPDRALTIAREVTKRFESIAVLPLAAAVAWLEADPNRVRGEFVLIVDVARHENTPTADDPGIDRWLGALLTQMTPAQAARLAVAATGLPRDVLYARARSLRGEAAAGADDDAGSAP